MTIGDRIRIAREAKGMSLEELGKAIGTSRQNVFRYEDGSVENIPIKKIKEIARVLSVSPAWIVGWEEESGLMEKKKSISDLLDSASSDQLKEIESFIRFKISQK